MSGCASTRCGNMSTPTSSARASASPISRSTTPRCMRAMRATSRRRCSLAAPPNIALVRGHHRAPAVRHGTSPVLPERSHYFDAGVTEDLTTRARARRRCLLQDRAGPARQRPVRPGAGAERLQLRSRLYHRLELSAIKRRFPGLRQSRLGQEKATQVVSNQFLFGATNSPTSPRMHLHRPCPAGPLRRAPPICGTAPAFPPIWIFGSGLRTGFANTDHVPPYTQVNLGISHDFRRLEQADHAALRRRQPVRHSMSSATAPASACSRRNTVRAVGSSQG